MVSRDLFLEEEDWNDEIGNHAEEQVRGGLDPPVKRLSNRCFHPDRCLKDAPQSETPSYGAVDVLELPPQLPPLLPGPAMSTKKSEQRTFGWMLLPLSLPLLIIASVLSWPAKTLSRGVQHIRRRDFSELCVFVLVCTFIVDPFFCLLANPFLLVLGDWRCVLGLSLNSDYPLPRWLLLRLPWPHGASKKLFAMACCHERDSVAKATGMEDGEDVTQKKQRKASRDLLKKTNFNKGGATADDDVLAALKECIAQGPDLDFASEDGRTLLHAACYYHNHECIEWLLSHGTNPNIQDFIRGYTPMHIAVNPGVESNSLDSDPKKRRVIEVLFDYEPQTEDKKTTCADFSLVDNEGLTPYMLCDADEYPGTLEALRPRPSWEQVEAILDYNNLSVEQLCDVLKMLVGLCNPKESRALRRLRLLDMLFCKHEGDEGELVRRRRVLFQKFLKPALLRSVQGEKIDDGLKETIRYVFNQSKGPPQESKNARSSYKDEYEAAMNECNKCVKKHYGAELERLREQDPDMATLLSFPEIEVRSKLKDRELMHWMEKPQWAIDKDLAAAARALQQAGILKSADEFCDLIQLGRHRLLPKPDMLFKEGIEDFRWKAPWNADFWKALVLMWSIGLQEKIVTQFDAAMEAQAGKASFRAGGIKAFPRSFEKALEYEKEKKLEGWAEQVCAGLHVIDGLRCSFVADTVEENIALGQRLEDEFTVVRTKNGHQPGNRSYADRKYNLLYKTTAEGIGEVAFLCEVQILMKRYIEIKEFEHLLYEFKR